MLDNHAWKIENSKIPDTIKSMLAEYEYFPVFFYKTSILFAIC